MNVIYFYLFLLLHPYLALWWTSFEKARQKILGSFGAGLQLLCGLQNFLSETLVGHPDDFPGCTPRHVVCCKCQLPAPLRPLFLGRHLTGNLFSYLLMAKLGKEEFLPVTNWANAKEVGKRTAGDHIVLFLSLPVVGHVVSFVLGMFSREKAGKRPA